MSNSSSTKPKICYSRTALFLMDWRARGKMFPDMWPTDSELSRTMRDVKEISDAEFYRKFEKVIESDNRPFIEFHSPDGEKIISLAFTANQVPSTPWRNFGSILPNWDQCLFTSRYFLERDSYVNKASNLIAILVLFEMLICAADYEEWYSKCVCITGLTFNMWTKFLYITVRDSENTKTAKEFMKLAHGKSLAELQDEEAVKFFMDGTAKQTRDKIAGLAEPVKAPDRVIMVAKIQLEES